MAIYTPLGKDYFLINKFEADEGLSHLFKFEVELLHEELEADALPTPVDPATIIGKAVTVAIDQRDGTLREFTGIVNRFSQGYRDTRFSFYNATVVPHLWILTQRINSRIFQNISVPGILDELLKDFEWSNQLQGTFEKRNYCVQYRESDFDFASRLMEEEGIYYFFEHKDGKHMLIIANTPQSHADCPSKSSIPFYAGYMGGNEDFITTISAWKTNHKYQTGKVSLWDFNFQLPTNKLDLSQTSTFNLADNQQLELYDFPSGYGRKYDGIDASGGDQSGALDKVFNDRASTVTNVINMLDSQVCVLNGVSDCSSLTSGYKFNLTDHPVAAENSAYVITRVTHQAEQNPTYVSNDESERSYSNKFRCIKHGAGAPPYRPPRKTPKPKVEGSQTAFVVGPSGEEIFTDKYGRVKVQFHWDRVGQVDSTSSCWVRVAQMWAGNKWGTTFIPRIGMEVIVNFLEGDPDQPIIVGCVYNPQTMPPYTLPDEKTKSTIKTNSSSGGGGFNELRFEDKKGEEQIFIHAEKDQDIRVKNDTKEIVLHDRHLIVQNNQHEKVTKDKHLKVGGDHNEKVDGTISVNAGGDFLEKATTKFAVDAGTEIHLKSGTTLTIETGTNLTLKVGGNFININPGGIFIKGAMVMLNSGGSAGSGSGSSPTAPTEPQEATNADPGQNVTLRPLSPPPPPVFTTLQALVLSQAADSGAAFCDI